MKKILKAGAFLLVCALLNTSTISAADRLIHITAFPAPKDALAPWTTRAVSRQINIRSERNETLSEIRFTKGGNAAKVAFCDVLVTDELGKILGTDRSRVPNYPRSFGKVPPNVVDEKSIGLGIPIKANQDNILTLAVDTWGLDAQVPEPWLQINVTGLSFVDNGITQGVDGPEMPFIGAIHRLGGLPNIGIYDVTPITNPINILLGGKIEFIGAIQTRTGSAEWTEMDTMPFSVLTPAFANPFSITGVVAADALGHIIAGPVDCTYVSEAGVGKFAFKDRIRIPPNTTGIYFYGNVGDDFSKSGEGTVSIATNPAEWTHVRGESSKFDFSMTRFGLVVGSTMQVRPTRLDVTITAPPELHVQGGQTNVTALIYELDATESGEDINVSALPYTFWTPLANMKADITGVRFVDIEDGKTISPEISPASFEDRDAIFITDALALNHPKGFNVPKGTKKRIALRVSFAAKADGIYVFAFIQGAPTASGASTGRKVKQMLGHGWSIIQATTKG